MIETVIVPETKADLCVTCPDTDKWRSQVRKSVKCGDGVAICIDTHAFGTSGVAIAFTPANKLEKQDCVFKTLSRNKAFGLVLNHQKLAELVLVLQKALVESNTGNLIDPSAATAEEA